MRNTQNESTRDFCLRFNACEDGTVWALNYSDMRSCYDALLRGEAGEYSASWAIWVVTREGVMSDRDLRLFAVRCARRVQHLMRDHRSVDALDVAERYALGEATDKELSASWAAAANVSAYSSEVSATSAARAAAWDVAKTATWAAARSTEAAAVAAAMDASIDVATDAERDAAYSAAWEAERKEQLKILAEFGNPFE